MGTSQPVLSQHSSQRQQAAAAFCSCLVRRAPTLRVGSSPNRCQQQANQNLVSGGKKVLVRTRFLLENHGLLEYALLRPSSCMECWDHLQVLWPMSLHLG